jgi:GT2 family glycosyltransferase/glycosyltransferase involved in cell wall biosynthesis/SAM-dependent methyltransferase
MAALCPGMAAECVERCDIVRVSTATGAVRHREAINVRANPPASPGRGIHRRGTGVSVRRRAAAPRLIEWTGERCVPWTPDVQVVYEHFHRYLWAASVVGGLRVLDLGSGEGFGAAILAESAAQVVGVDVDERTVQHSRLNYAAANLDFHMGTALDLSAFEEGSFGAVVAFEIIEHVQDHERVLEEVTRLLADDGLLVISTPDRRLYSEVTGQRNPFHEHELGLEEFHELLGRYFPHLASWGQRTITGSHMHVLGSSSGAGDPKEQSDFYIERSGDEWRLAGDPAALYVVALASKVTLPEMAGTSTLADCGLELVRSKEHDTGLVAAERDVALHLNGELRLEREHERAERDRERALHGRELHERDLRSQEELAQRDYDVARRQEEIVDLRARIASSEAELAAAVQLNRRTEESVTWQAFQRFRGRLYGSIGETSLFARTLRLSLRLAGRIVIKRPKSLTASPESDEARSDESGAASMDGGIEMLSLPEYENPKVSLIIPLYGRADLTRACLESIRDNTTQVSYEVILVDDAADEPTKRLLEGVRGARIVRNEKNLGYLRSMNRGADLASGRWLVLFNNDTEVTQGWLGAMLACAESAEDVGVVTPKFIYPDGSLNEAGAIIWRDGTGANYGRGDAPDLFQYEYRRETDYGSAAALMVSADLWAATGGFDERYLPMYYEDADLCFEARERGLRVLYEPEAVVIHIEGATAGNDEQAGHKCHQEQNRPRFVDKWRRRLESEHLRSAPTNVRAAANRHRGKHVLVVDHRVPMWDRDAGSLRMLRIMQALIELGARVTFMPDNFAASEPYTAHLQRMGIEVLYGHLDVRAEIAAIGSRLDMAILSRPHQASRWLDLVREFAPSAIVAYDTVDLHWLREARRGALGSSLGLLEMSNGSLGSIAPKAEALRHLELAMIRATDATIVVSNCEREQVERDVPGSRVIVVPTVHDVEPYVQPPEDRSGVLFVGGFEHHPNIDAAVRLVKEVMPAVWRELGDVEVTIVGSKPPAEVQALASSLVDVAGWVEDLQPLLDGSRLMVVPLRFGAGLKGKITQALAAGLPVVTTPVGAEGLEVREDVALLVAEDAEGLAADAVRVYRDDELWRTLSRSGQSLMFEQCSTKVLSERLSDLLDSTMGKTADGVRS